MSELMIDGEHYVSAPEPGHGNPCFGCAFDCEDDRCHTACRSFDCVEDRIIWIKAPVDSLRDDGGVPTLHPPTNPKDAIGLLNAAADHMHNRSATYDSPKGERSIGKTVEAFNTITGRDLRESEGWLLLALLKIVRSETRDDPHQDSVEDLIAYSALFGEARLGGK